MRQALVMCIMGKSASGKSWLINKIIQDKSFCKQVKSKTTRKVRDNDPNDINTHIFCTEEELLKDKENGNIISLYTDPKKGYSNWITIDCFTKEDYIINIMAIDIDAYRKLCNNTPKDMRILKGFYVLCDEDIRKKRLKDRGEEYKEEHHLEISDEDLKIYDIQIFQNN